MEAEDTEYLKLPLEDRCTHKLWKARVNGYEECTQYFATLDEKAPEFNKFAPLMKKFVTDSNAIAQEKALDAVLSFATNAHIAGKTTGDVTAGIVIKCLAAAKRTTQDKALEVLLMYCEIEKFESVQEELIKGFTQKNPKVVAGCVRAITTSLREFGSKVMAIKPLVKVMGTLLEDRDKNVREEAKKMVVEMYRWAGHALKPQLSSLKPIQIQELEAEFEKLRSEKAVQNRLLRSQQDVVPTQAEDQADGEERDTDEEQPKEVDPLDFLDPVNILDQLPKDFYEKVEAKKWQERKEALDALLPLSQNEKLEAGDYADLAKVLKKIIGKDTNVMIVALAGQCLAGLAKGLKKKFSPYAISCADTVFEKFKEKKLVVVTALREAVDAIFHCTTLEALQETFVGALNNKNPNVKAEAAGFLARSFCYCTPTILNKKMLKTITTELLKKLSESDPNVRENAAEALGTVLKVVGEKTLGPFINDLDSLKMQKVKDYSEKADIKVKITVPKAKPKSAPAAVKEASKTTGAKSSNVRGAKVASNKVVKSGEPKGIKGGGSLGNDDLELDPGSLDVGTEESLQDVYSDKPKSKIASHAGTKSKMEKAGNASAGGSRGAPVKKGLRAPSAGRSATSAKKEEEVDNSPLLQVNQIKQEREREERRLKTLKWDFSIPRAEFITQLKDQLINANANKQLISNMFHQDFKFHIRAIDGLSEDLANNVDACTSNLDLILRWLTIRFFDTNPSVIMKGMDYLQRVFSLLTEREYHLTELEASSFLPYLITKFGEPKNSIRGPAREICKLICNIYPSSKVSPYILSGLSSKNARQRAECLEAIGSLIEIYGISVCQTSSNGRENMSSIKEIARQIADRDNSVRNAALNALVQIYFREGEKVYKMIGNVSGKDLCLLEERIKRSAKNRPVIKKPVIESELPPQRVPKPVSTTSGRPNRVIPTPAAQPPPVHREGRTNPPVAPAEQGLKRFYQPFSGDAGNLNSQIHIDYDLFEKLLDDPEVERPSMHLEEIPDVPSIIHDDTVSQIRSRLKRPGITSTMASNIINTNNNNEDNSQAITMVITQVATHEVDTVITALSQLDEVMQSEDKRHLLCPHVDQILIMTTLQYRLVLNTRMSNTQNNDCIKIYRSLTNCLMNIFNNKELGSKTSRDVLHDAIHAVLSVLLDNRLPKLEDSSQVIRALNVLVVRIIEKSQFSHIFSAVLKLLNESVGNGVSSKLTDLVMRCNWKCIRLLPQRIRELDIPLVLTEILNFMVAYPAHTWIEKPCSKPLRTIKTVIHKLVELRGNSLLTDLSQVPNCQGSELQRYIYKALNATKTSVVTDDAETNDSNRLVADSQNKESDATNAKSNRKLSKSANSTLSEIFKKIGSKENTKEGLVQLYEFKQKNPDADIDSYLRKSSTFFQNYIEKGLKKVEMERLNMEGSKMSTSASSDGSQNSAPLTSLQVKEPKGVNVNELVDQFKSLAAQAGFDDSYIDCAVRDIGISE